MRYAKQPYTALFREIQITILLLFTLSAAIATDALALPDSQIGIIVMHGKGGTPTNKVGTLTRTLEREGFLTSAPTMPWTGDRGTAYYLESLESGFNQISDEIAILRSQGARKIFLAGHSLGAAIGLSYTANRKGVDGFIAIAIGHIAGSKFHNRKSSKSVKKAQAMVNKGIGERKGWFSDYNTGGRTPEVNTTAEIYLSYFDPDGPINVFSSSSKLKGVPVLFIAPDKDPITRKGGPKRVYDRIQRHPLSRYTLIDAGHGSAPAKGRKQIIEWIRGVAVATISLE